MPTRLFFRRISLRNCLCTALQVSIASLLIESGAQAASATWSASGTGAQAWATDGNWTPAAAPGATSGTTNGDTATFSAATTGTAVTIDAGRNIKFLSFGSTAGTYTIGSDGANAGEALHLSSGGNIAVVQGMTNVTTINAPLVLEAATSSTAGAFTINNAANVTTALSSVAKLNVAGNISGGTTSSTAALTLSGTVGTRNGASAAAALVEANTISGIISDGGVAGGMSLTVSGNQGSSQNAWNLTGANTFSGSVTNSGVLYFNSIANKGTASALGTGAATGATISVGGFFIYTGATASSDRTFTGAGGSFYNNGTGVLTLTGAFSGSGVTFRGNTTSAITVSGLISGASFTLNKTNGNLLTLANDNNSFGGGALNVSAGTIAATSIADKLTNSAIGAGSTIAFGQNQTGDNIGRLQLTSPTGGASNRDVIINGGSTNTLGAPAGAVLENTVAGQMMTMSGPVRTLGSGTTAYTSLELAGAGNGTMNGVLGGTVNAPTTPSNLALLKSGTGTWTVNAANLFYGKTSVNGGSLLLGSSAKLDGTHSVAVAANATLGGSGTIRTDNTSAAVLQLNTTNPGSVTGNIAVASGGIVAPGSATGTGTLTIDSGTSTATNVLSLASGAKFRFKLDTGLQSDTIALINGSAGDILFGGNTIDFTDLTGGSLAAGTYTLFTANVAGAYSGLTTSGGTITGGLTIGSGLSAYTSSSLSVSGNNIVLTVAVPEPGQIALLLSGLVPIFLRRRRG